jgi:hypothetical protein
MKHSPKFHNLNSPIHTNHDDNESQQSSAAESNDSHAGKINSAEEWNNMVWSHMQFLHVVKLYFEVLSQIDEIGATSLSDCSAARDYWGWLSKMKREIAVKLDESSFSFSLACDFSWNRGRRR